MKKDIFDDISKLAEELNEIQKKPKPETVKRVDRYIDEENKKNKVSHEPELNAQNAMNSKDSTAIREGAEEMDIECMSYEDAELDEFIKVASESNVDIDSVINFIDKIAEEFGEDLADITAKIILSTTESK